MNGGNQRFIKRRHHFDPRGPVVAIEYPLPGGDSISRSVRHRIDPWIAACIGCGPDEVRDRLKQRWSHLNAAGIGALARFFRRLTPCSILVREDDAWLMLRDRPSDEFETGREWFLPPPTPTAIVREALSRFQIRKEFCLEVFLREFAGFREELPNVSGYFPRVQDWLPFEQYAKEMGWESRKKPRVWERAAVVYEALNGDVIVLDRTARLAWWCHDDDQVRILFERFEPFSAHWLKFLRKNYPLSQWP